MTHTQTTTTAEAIMSLRYWASASYAASIGPDLDAHESTAYDGLATALDDGLLAHNARTDTYHATPKGTRVLDAL